jgi:photosystem II stability/assembly factor-like uncharacterized protein
MRRTTEDIDREFATGNPVDYVDLQDAVHTQMATALLSRILEDASLADGVAGKGATSGARGHHGADRRSVNCVPHGGPRRGLAVVVAAAAVIALTGTLFALSGGFGTSSGNKGRTATPKPADRATATWKLAGYVAPPGWKLQSTGTTRGGTDMTCPTSSFCVWSGAGKGGGAIIVSHDSGGRWQQTYTAPKGMRLRGATCPTQTTCMVASTDFSLALTARSGTVSNPPTRPGGALIVTHDGGMNWTTEPMPADLVTISSLSCTSDTDCVAVGTNGVTVYSCTEATGSTHCTTIATATSRVAFAAVTTNGGKNWATKRFPKRVEATELQCFATGRCIAAGSIAVNSVTSTPVVIYSDDGGLAWSAASVPAGSNTALSLSCAGPTHCLAVTSRSFDSSLPQGVSSVLVSDDGGELWSKLAGVGLVSTSPALWHQVTTFTCPTATRCYAVGQAMTPPTTPPLHHRVSTVSTGVSRTYTTNGVILATSDGGKVWSTEQLPVSTVSMLTLSCSPTRCFAGGLLQTQRQSNHLIQTKQIVLST